MAGRFLILEFDDPDSAASLAQNKIMAEQLGFKPYAMFILPKRFCECPDRSRQHAANWKRGSRTGLQVCAVCKRPSKFHMEGLMKRLQYLFGYNQL